MPAYAACGISIHALLAESDLLILQVRFIAWAFLSTLSLRRATESQQPCARPTTNFYPRSPCGERREKPRQTRTDTNFYPRSPCGERPRQAGQQQQHHNISIHALLAESDNIRLFNSFAPSISIHALLAESDVPIPPNLRTTALFLSTLSLRRATSSAQALSVTGSISIHALLAESDNRCHALCDF